MSAAEQPRPESLLIQECLAGDQEAWRLLHRLYHPQLLLKITELLGPGARKDRDTAEEIAGRVWLALVVRDSYRLRIYDPRRGSFNTYLRALVRQVIQQEYRRHGPRSRGGRHRPREVRLAGAGGRDATILPTPLAALLGEFEATLTPRERQFLREHLLGPSAGDACFRVSSAYRRKLRQRVTAKLLAFLSTE
jgi:hypothetical protein